jgi:hypothetical protein
MPNGDGVDADDSAGRPGQAVWTSAQLNRLLQAQGFDLSMVAFGTTAAILTMVARLEDAKDWGSLEFFALLGFGALQILLGFLDRTFARQVSSKHALMQSRGTGEPAGQQPQVATGPEESSGLEGQDGSGPGQLASAAELGQSGVAGGADGPEAAAMGNGRQAE